SFQDASTSDEELAKINKAAKKLPTYKSIRSLVLKKFYKVLEGTKVKRQKASERQRLRRSKMSQSDKEAEKEKARKRMKRLRSNKRSDDKVANRKYNNERKFLIRSMKRCENDMDPFDVPNELKDLTHIEKQLISRVHTKVVDTLPHLISDLHDLVHVQLSEDVILKDFVVRKAVVLDALNWLKKNNPLYKDIVISSENLAQLPDDDNVISLFRNLNSDEQNDVNAASTESDENSDVHPSDETENLSDDDVDEDNEEDSSLTHTSVPSLEEPSLTRSLDNVLIWPSIGSTPVNEFGHNVEDLTMKQRMKLLSENPLIADTFFYLRSQFFIEKCFKKKFDVKDIWFRYEFQHRGSIHVHGLAWLKDAPLVKDNLSLEQQEELVKYFDKFISCENPNSTLLPSSKHPCEISIGNINDFNEDYAQLLNHVQRHTKCKKGYCLRHVKGSKCLSCKYDFPKDLQDRSFLEYKDDKLVD
ncbi:hypothetical protein FOCC_FOCC015295, partial [Frankliniella occidentalis]